MLMMKVVLRIWLLLFACALLLIATAQAWGIVQHGPVLTYHIGETGAFMSIQTHDVRTNVRYPLVQHQRNLMPQWSPDGAQLVYLRYRGQEVDLTLWDATGRASSLLVRDVLVGATPQWSPDGRRIALTMEDEGQLDLYAVEAANGAQIQLTDSNSVQAFQWLPDSRRLLLQMQDEAGQVQAYMIALAAPLQLIPLDARLGTNLRTLSPDGRYFLEVEAQTLYRVNRQSLRRFALHDSLPQYTNLAWAAHSQQIAFSSIVADKLQWALYTLRVDGSDLQRLLTINSEILAIAWSPDKMQLMLMTGNALRRQVYVVNADGSHLRQLAVGHMPNSAPAWQP